MGSSLSTRVAGLIYSRPQMSNDRIGRYQLMHLLGAGGMGEVFLSMSGGPGGFSKIVVVKRILPFLAQDAATIEMFLNEARVAALLTHPNLVQIFELGQDKGTYFLAMEYVHGYSLRGIRAAMMKSGRWMIPALAASICAQALRGLHYAHTFCDYRGEPLRIIHRDVSPDNILVGFDGNVKVTDFGIAKIARERGSTAPGVVKGKLAYMAPEVFHIREVDARADLFAMGAVIYELLAGLPPFKGASLREYFERSEKTPQPIRDMNPECPEALEQIVLRALAWDRDKRFETAVEFAQALEEVAEDRRARDPMVVAAFMRELFGEDAAAHHPAAIAVSGLPISHTPLPAQHEVGPLTMDVGAALTRVERPGTIRIADEAKPPPAARPAKRHIVSLSAGVLVLAGLGAVASRSTDASPTPVTALEPAPDPAPAPLPGPVSPPERVAAVAPAPAGASPSTSAEAEPDPAPSAPAAPEVRPPVRRTPTSPSRRKQAAERGRLSVRVTPWANVVMDGRPLGATPLPSTEIPAGRHVLLLEHPPTGQSRRVVINVPANGEVVVKETFLGAPQAQ